ncbi:hypothetical protein M1432_00870 [Patescibacteria group bacterium]|nr:hypothetical protein [Patescibacteria group bacterium]
MRKPDFVKRKERRAAVLGHFVGYEIVFLFSTVVAGAMIALGALILKGIAQSIGGPWFGAAAMILGTVFSPRSIGEVAFLVVVVASIGAYLDASKDGRRFYGDHMGDRGNAGYFHSGLRAALGPPLRPRFLRYEGLISWERFDRFATWSAGSAAIAYAAFGLLVWPVGLWRAVMYAALAWTAVYWLMAAATYVLDALLDDTHNEAFMNEHFDGGIAANTGRMTFLAFVYVILGIIKGPFALKGDRHHFSAFHDIWRAENEEPIDIPY